MPDLGVSATVDVRREAMRAEIREGLSRTQKELPPKYFYDTRGSELFERITALPEYYLTRTERALLERCIPEWIQGTGTRTVVELGAGSAAKTRVILDAVYATGPGGAYVPVDVSGEFLAETARGLREDYPNLRVVPVVADIADSFELPPDLPRPAFHAFLGSTIGNFAPPAAAMLLARLRARMADDDRFLLGVDLHKSQNRLEAAYNDQAGVTAEFNLNVLHVLNRELGADFETCAFQHRAIYDSGERRIEMHLVSTTAQRVQIPGVGVIRFEPGETIRTEISCKYERDSVHRLLSDAGLQIDCWEADAEGLYALVIARPA